MRLARPLRYLVVATLGSAVQAIVVTIAVWTGWSPVLATIIGIEAAILHNFAWHDRWTWGDRPRDESRVLQLVRYNAAMAGSSLLTGGLVAWAVIQALGGGILAANVAAVAAGACANYAASDTLIFARASAGVAGAGKYRASMSRASRPPRGSRAAGRSVTPLQYAAITAAAAAGGAINAVAGGGTLVTFPTIVWLGVPTLVANATSTVALWPGLASSMWGYRGELAGAGSWAVRFAIPSVAGGALGACLLLVTSARTFDRIVPFLVMGATVLFLLQNLIRRRFGPGQSRSSGSSEVVDAGRAIGAPPFPFLAAQFVVAVYGGYFGAGIGILMLAALGAMGLTNIHQMNGLKNWGALCINAVAALLFASSGIVNWTVASAMAVGGLAGGYGGAWLAQRAGQDWARRAVVAVGCAASAWLMFRAF